MDAGGSRLKPGGAIRWPSACDALGNHYSYVLPAEAKVFLPGYPWLVWRWGSTIVVRYLMDESSRPSSLAAALIMHGESVDGGEVEAREGK